MKCFWTNEAVLLLTVISTAVVAGCSNASPTPEAVPSEAATHQHAQGEHGDVAVSGEIAEALASLSAEERAAVLRQRICPVTEEPLGSMGAPKKVRVNDRDVWICCEACEEALQDEPEKYLARIPK